MKRFEDSGGSASGPRRSEREVSAGLTLSGMLIAVSFIAMVIPLAVYHVAQVAAAMRLRTGVLLLLCVVGIVLLLGFTFQSQLLVLGGVMGSIWTPLILIGLFERSRNHPYWLTLAAFLLPLSGALALAFMLPQIPDFASFYETRKELILSEMAKTLSNASAESQQETLSLYRKNLEAFRETPDFDILGRLAGFDGWQRWVWMVFGSGAGLFLGLVVIAFGNLIFLDFAYEQVEKFRAVLTYVLANRTQFGGQLTENLESLRTVRRAMLTAGESPLAVESVVRLNGKGDKEKSPWASRLFLPKTGPLSMILWGHEFRLKAVRRIWGLRHMSLPLWLALLAVATLVSLTLARGSLDGLLEAAAAPGGWALASASLAAFFVVGIVAVQGLLTIYIRVAPFLLLLLLLAFLMVGSAGVLSAHVMVAVFCTVGLLDYVYDFRGRAAKPLRD